MIHLNETLDEFAARRRKSQTDLERRIRQRVEDVLSERDWATLLDFVEDLYREVYEDESGVTPTHRMRANDRRGLLTSLEQTSPDTTARTADTIAVWLATAVLSIATMDSSEADEEDLFMQWVDMRDEAVRPAHRSTHGQVRPPGEDFDVDGVGMPYPGWPKAPIELWINCRCTLRPVLASEVNEAITAAYRSSLLSLTRDLYDHVATVFALPKTQTCKYCDQPATKRIMHAEGKAYVPVCDDHEDKGIDAVGGRSEVDRIDSLASFVPNERDGIPTQPGEDDRSEVAECTCCGGPGEHDCGHECYACDASGTRQAQSEASSPICAGHHGVPDPCDDGRQGSECEHEPDKVSPDDIPEGTPEFSVKTSAFISEKPWSGSPSRFTDEQYKRSCVLHVCEGLDKKCHKLPIREPTGELSRAGTHSAAQRITSVTGATDQQKAAAKASLRSAYKQLGDDPPDTIKAALDWDAFADEPVSSGNETAPSGNTSTCVVALPAAEDPVHGLGEEPSHVTLLFLGEVEDSVAEVLQTLTQDAANHLEPFNAPVNGRGELGPDGAKVLFTEHHNFNVAKGMVEQNEHIADVLHATDTHPHFIPHLTVTYGDSPDDMSETKQITFDRLAVWHGDDQTEYPMNGDSVAENEEDQASLTAAGEVKVPWHGVLAPEDVWSGDRRKFGKDSLRHRDLPLPLTWQKISDDGHKGNVTVATIDDIEKVDGLMRASGYFLASPEADEVVGLIREFGRFGVSVDADDSVYEVDEDEEGVIFSDARVSSACIVPIPAFQEAFVALGMWEDVEDPLAPDQGEQDPKKRKKKRPEPPQQEEEPAGLMTPEEFVDVAPGRTEDGPGWLTHPVDTDRLRDYWVRGPGAAKIGWGTPGDFDRCRVNVAEYVKPEYLNGYCANRHYDALGAWPGREVAAAETMELSNTEAAEALSMTASIGHKAPAAWFADPEFTEATPLTVTDEGQVYGHIATWDTCHIGFEGQCVEPPRDCLDRGNFLTGYVPLDDGCNVATGVISVGGGHASPNLRARAAIEHYDSTSAAAADVTAGTDDIGIWCAGWIRPGTSDEMVTALRASPLSGDWRQVGFNPDGSEHLELVAALAVNVQGFAVPRVQVAASGGQQLSLVAAGAVPQKRKPEQASIDYDQIAAKVVEQINAQQQRKTKMAALAARFEEKESAGA